MSARGGLNLAYNHKDFLSRLGGDYLMKKKYEAPTAETVKFEYKDQVVAASGSCGKYGLLIPTLEDDCKEGIAPHQ